MLRISPDSFLLSDDLNGVVYVIRPGNLLKRSRHIPGFKKRKPLSSQV